MQLSQESSRAASYLRNIFESGKTLKLSDPVRLMNGNSYAFVVTGCGKKTDFCLPREQLDNVSGSREYRDAASALARDFEFRFKNYDPNLFVSTSGRVLHISPEWPTIQFSISATFYSFVGGCWSPLANAGMHSFRPNFASIPATGQTCAAFVGTPGKAHSLGG